MPVDFYFPRPPTLPGSALRGFLFLGACTMQITWMPIGDIKPYEKNPRKNSRTVEKLVQSIKEYGWQQPLVVDKDNVLIVGHARWRAAVKLGLAEVPVHRALALTEVQARSYRLADNRLSEESSWDQNFLTEELAALRELEMDLSLTGFRETELSRLLELPQEPVLNLNSTKTDQPISKPGDIWLLGNHRVMCGNAANLDDVAQLMQDQKAVSTSPLVRHF
ncbi:MAG: ParB N-terminal domain-containing protein [Gammaproteobacteria bacterium]